jgi:hypothetical protein
MKTKKTNVLLEKGVYSLLAVLLALSLVFPGCVDVASEDGDNVLTTEEIDDDDSQTAPGELSKEGEDDSVLESVTTVDITISGEVEEVVEEVVESTESTEVVESTETSDSEITTVDLTIEEAPVVEEEPESVSVYTDGTYSSSGVYTSPSGSETITVSLTVADDVVSGVSVSGGSENATAQQYQDLFIAGVSSAVIGQSLESLSLGAVNGSSLTPGGFNSAVDSIRSSAQA